MRTIDLDGSPRVLVTVRDIDQSMRTQMELADLNADLERRVQERTSDIRREREALETFSYTVSHDLRAPLRAIDGFSRVLVEDYGRNLPKEGAVLVDRIIAGAGRMGRLIEALLSLSRVGRREVVLKAVDVAGVVRETIDELMAGSEFGATGEPAFVVTWEVGDLPDVRSDPDMVRRVFANLLGNACKFTNGVAAPLIRVDSERRPDGIWFQVADNGIGFDMAQSGRLFKAFQRLHGESVEGIGIGLATVKKIIDHLGGRIEAEGAPGSGATFRFRLGPPMDGTGG
jgi:signal transduction histidine kinase